VGEKPVGLVVGAPAESPGGGYQVFTFPRYSFLLAHDAHWVAGASVDVAWRGSERAELEWQSASGGPWQSLAHQAGGAERNVAHVLANQPRRSEVLQAAIRAHYRDKEWLDREVARGRQSVRAANKALLLTKLRQAKAAFLRRQQVPLKRFTMQIASQLLGRSAYTLAKKMVDFDIDRCWFVEDPAHFKVRAILAAQRQCLADREKITATGLVRQVHAVQAEHRTCSASHGRGFIVRGYLTRNPAWRERKRQ
jgi:predicted RNA-binding protein YlxR (DUF448 family)